MHYRKIILSIVLAGLFLAGSVSAQLLPKVNVGQGELLIDGIINSIENNSSCKRMDIAVDINEIRMELDKESDMVAGLARLSIFFNKDCSDASARLVKDKGTIRAIAVISGFNHSGTLKGKFDLILDVPALISFKADVNNLPWSGTFKGNTIAGGLDVVISEFEFREEIPFKLTTSLQEPNLLTPQSPELTKLKKDLAEAEELVSSYLFDKRGEGVYKLKNIVSRLPIDKRPLYQIDVGPELDLLFQVFEAYITCVDKNVQQQAAGNPQWEDCLYSAGDLLQKAEVYAREAEPRDVSSSYYLQLASLWDNMRYYANFAAKEVKYDKVENCERAKKAANKAVHLNPYNEKAEQFLENLDSSMGCSGMPLFGINREEMERERQEALEAALKGNLRVENDEDYQDERDFADSIDEAEDSYDDTTEEEKIDNAEQNVLDVMKTLNDVQQKVFESLQAKMSDEQASQFAARMDGAATLAEQQAILREMKKSASFSGLSDSGESEEDGDFWFNTARNVFDGSLMASDLEFMYNMFRGNDLGSYNGVCFMADTASAILNYMDYKDEYGHEDAVVKAAMDSFGSSALKLVPVVRAISIVTNTPKKLMEWAGVEEDSDAMVAADTLYNTFSPDRAVQMTTELMAKNTLGDVARAVVHQAKKVKEADGFKETMSETGKLVAGTTGAVVVASTRVVRNVVVETSRQTFGRLFTFLGSKFY